MKRERGKNLLWITLTTLLILSIFTVFQIQAQVWTTVSVEPPSIMWTYPVNKIGDNFTIAIHVDNVTNLWDWQAGMTFNPAVLRAYTFEEGPFLKLGGVTLWMPGTINNTAGIITFYGDSLTVGSTPVNGSGDLAYVSFQVIGFGTSDLTLTDVMLEGLTDTTLYSITVNIFHGYFELPPPPPVPPIAYFTFSPISPFAGDTVTFDASGSTDGWDGTAWQSLTSWDWDFGDGTFGTGEIVTHVYGTEGTYLVNLTVTASGNPAGYQTASETKSVTVYAPIVGAFVDIYTEKVIAGVTTFRGEGIAAPGNAFAPGEEVDLYAHVTYAGEAVSGVNVAFQVNYPDGTFLLLASDMTNATGIATMKFRIDQSPLPPFGSYFATATVILYEESVSDTLVFNVGWIVEITDAFTSDELGNPVSTFSRGATAYVKVAYKNIDPYDAHRAIIVVSLFDAIGKSVGIAFIDISIAPGSEYAIIGVTIKSQAILGPATARMNALTNWPALGGAAYSPEVIAPFAIA